MEIDHLLKLDAGSLVTHDLEQAKEKVNWWLVTPQGERWGDPAWGHRLVMFKHDAPGVSMEVGIEAHIFNKMQQDMPLLQIQGIRAATLNESEVSLIIETNIGLIDTSFDRANA
ncbi:hypothetical protein HWV00_21245 (plasmid) [Moritella sp. 24]|uniref:hypothetical protein n=1 Tax=Moritella sp. 24 TaxID=2746230 RepID=UPI001BACB9F9|nr:hypothetical protein [Moritella sp. 24]QUM78801.1 hypothetical protein HWV00_21245 [Moritella sp. 24]